MSKKLLVINVLPKDAYNDCHIEGSISVPFDYLAQFVSDFDKDQPIVVYCASYICSASRKAWKLLNQMGFTDVSAYEGGTAEWFQKGLPAQGACQADYISKVHVKPEQTGQLHTISASDLEQRMKKDRLL